MMATNRHIDDEQAKTVEEHYQMIMGDETLFDSKYTKVTADNLPTWFNEDLFRKAQDYFHDNFLSLMLSYVTGAIAMIAVPSIAKVFVSTDKPTQCAAFKKYFTTELLVIDLHGENVTDSNSRFYKSINTIRYMHSMVCKRAERNNYDGIKQKQLVIGLHGFTAYTLLKSEDFGLMLTKEEREAYNHFWRVIGHLIGISDRLNVCRKNEYETTLLCEKIFNEHMIKQLTNLNSDFYHLINISTRGLQNVDPTLDIDAFLLLFHDINRIPYNRKISWYSKIMYWYRKGVVGSFSKYSNKVPAPNVANFFFLQWMVLSVYCVPIIGGVSKIFWNKFTKLILWLGVNYPLLAWLKFGKQDSKLKLYPYSKI